LWVAFYFTSIQVAPCQRNDRFAVFSGRMLIHRATQSKVPEGVSSRQWDNSLCTNLQAQIQECSCSFPIGAVSSVSSVFLHFRRAFSFPLFSHCLFLGTGCSGVVPLQQKEMAVLVCYQNGMIESISPSLLLIDGLCKKFRFIDVVDYSQRLCLPSSCPRKGGSRKVMGVGAWTEDVSLLNTTRRSRARV
jgi:hypothetical protein